MVHRCVKLSAHVPAGQSVVGAVMQTLVTGLPQVPAWQVCTQVRKISFCANQPGGHCSTQRPVVLSPKVLGWAREALASGQV